MRATRSCRLATLMAVMLLSMMPLSMMSSSAAARPAMLGTYHGNGCDGVKGMAGFSQWLGRKPDFMLDFLAFNSWQDMLDDAGWTLRCWQPTRIPVVFSVPMLPKTSETLAQGAAGQFDDKFATLASMLVAHGYGNAIIRLGWEFNGGWYPWAAQQDPQNWVKYWRRIVTVMRAVPGTSFRFDWTSAQGQQQLPSDSVYPGDDYVDIIGQDTYNQTWSAGVHTPEQRWQELRTQAYGLDWLREFARAHGKPISIPEWGTGTRPDGHGGGDDALFITNMHAFIRDNQVLYHAYWDFPAADFNGRLSDRSKPRAAAQFVRVFGVALNEGRTTL